MKELTTNKEITCVYLYNRGANAYLRSSYRGYYCESGHVCVTEDYIKDVDLNKTIPTATIIPEKAKLVFHSTSKFPRHKLQITTFQRKIKENLADFMIGNAKALTSSNYTNYIKAFISENFIFVTHDSDVTIDLIKKSYSNTISETFVIKNNYKILTIDKEQLLYIEYMKGLHTLPLISDDQLNNIVDSKNDKITEDEVDGVIDLLKSRNSENIELGIKLFSQFNLGAMPLFANLFMTLFQNEMRGIRTSVSYKNLLLRFPPSYKNDYNIKRLFEKHPISDEQEKVLVTKLLKMYIGDYLEKCAEDTNEILGLVGLKYKINLIDA